MLKKALYGFILQLLLTGTACSLDANLEGLASLNPNLTTPTPSLAFKGEEDFNFQLSFNGTSGFEDSAYDSFVDGSDRIILIGQMHSRPAVWCLNKNGTYCTSFGTDGVVYLPGVRFDSLNPIFSLTRDSQSRIIAGVQSQSGSEFGISIFRLSTNGIIDSSFAGVGKFQHTSSLPIYIRDLVVDNSDNLLILTSRGMVNPMASHSYIYQPVLWRLNSNGDLDNTFSGDGDQLIPHPFAAGENYNNTQAYHITFDTAGSMYLAGSSRGTISSEDAIIWKLNPDGTPDTAFANNGIQILRVGPTTYEGATQLIVTSTAIFAAVNEGLIDTSGILWKLNLDGSTDTSFNGTGKLVISNIAGTAEDKILLHSIDGSGNILFHGISNNGNGFSSFAGRALANGSLDTSFNGVGYNLEDLGISANWGTAQILAKFSDNSLMMIGTAVHDPSAKRNYRDLLLWKLDSNGITENSFGTNGLQSLYRPQNIHLNHSMDIESNIAITSDEEGNSYIVSQINRGKEGMTTFLTKLNPQGKLVTSFGSSGQKTFNNLESASLSVTASGLWLNGIVYDSNTGDYNFVIYKMDSSGQTDTSFGSSGSLNLTLDGNLWQVQPSYSRLSIREHSNGTLIAIARVRDSSSDNQTLMWKISQAGIIDSTLNPGFDFKTLSILIPGQESPHFELGSSSEIYIVAAKEDIPTGEVFLTIGKLSSTGTLDTSFGNNGYMDFTSLVPTADYAWPESFKLTDNHILFFGQLYSDALDLEGSFVAKADLSGSLDPSFGDNGAIAVSTNLNAANEHTYINDVRWLASGKILIALTTWNDVTNAGGFAFVEKATSSNTVEITKRHSTSTAYWYGGKFSTDTSFVAPKFDDSSVDAYNYSRSEITTFK